MMVCRGLCWFILLGPLAVSAYSRQLRLKQSSDQGPLDGFYPDEVLCTLGKDGNGNTLFFEWCINWVQCIEKKAQPTGTPEAVLKAWAPADCHEICGMWPPKPPPTTTTTVATTTTQAPTTTAQLVEEVRIDEMDETVEPEHMEEIVEPPRTRRKVFCPPWVAPAECQRIADMANSFALKNQTIMKRITIMKEKRAVSLVDTKQRDSACLQSCERFKTTFSTCVSTIIFDPGRLGNMGGLKKQQGGGLRKKVPEVCKEEACMPDLPIKRQRCVHHRTQLVLNPDYNTPEEVRDSCPHIEKAFEDCKDCPQLNGDYQTQYAAFTGGCLDQMHAYYKATSIVDEPGKEPYQNIGIPRESGCSMQ